jgi:hypothetical protein
MKPKLIYGYYGQLYEEIDKLIVLIYNQEKLPQQCK